MEKKAGKREPAPACSPKCPQCGLDVAANAIRCPRCHTLLIRGCSGSCSSCHVAGCGVKQG
jgi:hypothetical protein